MCNPQSFDVASRPSVFLYVGRFLGPVAFVTVIRRGQSGAILAGLALRFTQDSLSPVQKKKNLKRKLKRLARHLRFGRIGFEIRIAARIVTLTSPNITPLQRH
jgi:hypothetical protein